MLLAILFAVLIGFLAEVLIVKFLGQHIFDTSISFMEALKFVVYKLLIVIILQVIIIGLVLGWAVLGGLMAL